MAATRIVRTVTISSGNGNEVSDAAEKLRDYRLAGIVMPGSWTAANLTFRAKATKGGTYQDVYDDSGTEMSVSVAASQLVLLTKDAKDAFEGIYGLKVRSGTAAAAVSQGADRDIDLVFVCG